MGPSRSLSLSLSRSSPVSAGSSMRLASSISAASSGSSAGVIDELGGERPPATARKLVHGYVSQLRGLLEPVSARGQDQVLMTRPPGYMLHVEPDQLDLTRFERLVAEARSVAA